MNECLTTPQYTNKSAIVCQTNGIRIKTKDHFNPLYHEISRIVVFYCYHHQNL